MSFVLTRKEREKITEIRQNTKNSIDVEELKWELIRLCDLLLSNECNHAVIGLHGICTNCAHYVGDEDK